MKEKQIYLNLAAQFVAFGVSFAISFFVSPIIVSSVGKETYGFLGIANNFTSYVLIITVALNSLAGRFVTVSYHQNNMEDANKYFTSVLFANLAVTAALVLPMIYFIVNIDKLLDVPMENIASIRWTFVLVFGGFFINLIASIFSVATFVKNKIYLASIRTIEANLIRLGVILLTFYFFKPDIAYVALALAVYNIFIAITNIRYTKKLIPEIKIRRKWFDFKKVRTLIVSGWWSSIISLSNVLLEGLDLLISNVMISASAMGTVSIVKTVPNMVYQCMGSVLGVFTPQLTISYAKGEIDEMISYLDYSCKIVAVILALPVAFIISFGGDFFALWMPTENAETLWTLSMLSMGGLVFAGSVVIMHNIFTVTNHLKIPALATLATGVLNTVIVFILLKTTKLGIYAVVSVSSILALCRNLFINIPYSAKCLNQRVARFYKIAFRSLLFVIISAVFGKVIQYIISPNRWITLIAGVLAMCIVSALFEFAIFFSKNEKKSLAVMLKSIARKG